MELHRLPGYAQRLAATRLSRRAAVGRLARREAATAVVAALALGPLPVAAQDHGELQRCCMYSTSSDPERVPLWRICALECAPAGKDVALLAVPVEDCGVCPPFPS